VPKHLVVTQAYPANAPQAAFVRLGTLEADGSVAHFETVYAAREDGRAFAIVLDRIDGGKRAEAFGEAPEAAPCP
jgi:hypothetical protein